MKKLKTFNTPICLSFLLVFYLSSPALSPAQKKKASDISSNLTQEYSSAFKEAENLQKKGEFLNSIELFKKSLRLARKIKDKKAECQSLLKLGLLYWNMGQLDESTKMYNQALSLAQKLDLKDEQDKCHNTLEIYRLYSEGKKYRSSGEYQKSIESFQGAIDLARKTGSKEHELKCLRQLSGTYWRLNRLQKFLILNKEALKISRLLQHKKAQGKCLNNIGVFFKKAENYSKALNHYEEALEIAQSMKNLEEESTCLNNIGIIYTNIGDYDKALEYLEKALTIDQKIGDNAYISMDLNNLGINYRRKGLISGNTDDFHKALNYYEKCLKLTRKTGDRKTEIQVLNNIGNVYSDLKNYLKALNYFQSGYKKAEEIQDIESMGMILNNLGIVYSNQGNYEESTKYYQKAIDLALEIKGDKILWEAYLELARAYEKQNKVKEALENYKSSISIIEDIRSQIKLEELKASYLGTDKRIQAYRNLIHLLITLHQSDPQKGHDTEAFDYMERAKARTFLDSLELSKVTIFMGLDLKLQNQEKELMKDISKLYTKLLNVENSSEEKVEIHEQLKTYENKWESLKREIRTKSPAYANLKYPEIITLKETQEKLLETSTAFFAYSIGKNNSYAFVITKEDLQIFPLPPRDTIHNQVCAYLKLINDKESQNFDLGYELFRKLVRPGLEENIKNIIFVPDDILYFLPFEALLTHNNSSDWLVKEYNIAYIPSISSFREIIHRKRSNGTKPKKEILALGDPFFGSLETEESGNDIFQSFYSSSAFKFFRLEYSGSEIERIGSLFKSPKSNILSREEATEEQFKQQNLEDYKIIHFATHSLIDEKKPARSAIVLSLDEDPTEDGFLQMREIFNLRLNSDLVTLSSCQTGLGQFIHGEGIEGLNRAFYYAGASSVLMTLWAVNDQASSQLMERFYYHLRSSLSIKNSLRKAKLEMIESETLSHPYYWAGFIISGEAHKAIFPQPKLKWVFFSMVLLLIAGAVFAAWMGFRKKLRSSS